MSDQNVQRLPAEELYQRELEALISAESDPIPTGWRMSPRSVLTYITGGTTVKGVEITPKYMGSRRLVEIAIATLVTDRALLLIGEPGTAKSWLSEHLAAAVNGDSTKVIQGTAGTTEEQIRYSWNYAMLIAKGPSPEAMVKSPVYRAMETGSIARVEEISRCASEVQDALISILSEKRLSVPELGLEVPAVKGFSVIATANTRDKGVNDMSAALKRLFFLFQEIADKLCDGRSLGSHVFRTELGLGLRLEYRFFHLDTDCRYHTVTNIGIFEILGIKLLNRTGSRLSESSQVCSSLRRMLPVHKRIIFLAILVAMRDNHLYIRSRQMNDGI